MERLICLLPVNPAEPWDTMSDQFSSSLWDIYPDIQVCGVGENDTIIVDGFKGALIQWSTFSPIQTISRLTGKRKILIYSTIYLPALFLLGIVIAVLFLPVGLFFICISIVVVLATPFYIPMLFTGKLYSIEPCLFGFEGYIPLPVIEKKLFGTQNNRLTWSPYGSPLSRHRSRRGYLERNHEEDVEASGTEPLLYTYPVEAVDPVQPCDACLNTAQAGACSHVPKNFNTIYAQSGNAYGEMKVSKHVPFGRPLIRTIGWLT